MKRKNVETMREIRLWIGQIGSTRSNPVNYSNGDTRSTISSCIKSKRFKTIYRREDQEKGEGLAVFSFLFEHLRLFEKGAIIC